MTEREEMGLLLYSSCPAAGPKSLYSGSNCSRDSPQMQIILSNGTGCGFGFVNPVISFSCF